MPRVNDVKRTTSCGVKNKISDSPAVGRKATLCSAEMEILDA